MTTKKEAEKLPLDLLAERVMGKVCRACNGTGEDNPTGLLNANNSEWPRCGDCHGAGTVLDQRWKLLREALWKEDHDHECRRALTHLSLFTGLAA